MLPIARGDVPFSFFRFVWLREPMTNGLTNEKHHWCSSFMNMGLSCLVRVTCFMLMACFIGTSAFAQSKEGPVAINPADPQNTLVIAYCAENGAAGISVKDEEYHATQLALKACQATGGSGACCTVEIVVYQQRCGAIAQSDEHYGHGIGATLELADQDAIRSCGGRGCKVRAHRCRY